MKKLIEKRGSISRRMKELIDGIKAETRAFNEEEQAEFNKLEADLAAVNATIDAEKRAEAAFVGFGSDDAEEQQDNGGEEVRAANVIVSDFIRGNELRAGEMTTTSTGSIIPSEFSADIIHDKDGLDGFDPVNVQVPDKYQDGYSDGLEFAANAFNGVVDDSKLYTVVMDLSVPVSGYTGLNFIYVRLFKTDDLNTELSHNNIWPTNMFNCYYAKITKLWWGSMGFSELTEV